MDGSRLSFMLLKTFNIIRADKRCSRQIEATLTESKSPEEQIETLSRGEKDDRLKADLILELEAAPRPSDV